MESLDTPLEIIFLFLTISNSLSSLRNLRIKISSEDPPIAQSMLTLSKSIAKGIKSSPDIWIFAIISTLCEVKSQRKRIADSYATRKQFLSFKSKSFMAVSEPTDDSDEKKQTSVNWMVDVVHSKSVKLLSKIFYVFLFDKKWLIIWLVLVSSSCKLSI